MRFRDKEPTADGMLPPFGALPVGEPQLKSRNRKLLRWFWSLLPLLVVFVLLGAGGLGLQYGAWRAAQASRGEEWDGALQIYEKQQWLTGWGLVPWVSHYNAGTAQLHLGQVQQGRQELEEAWTSVPKATPNEDGKIQSYSYECQVRINLAVSWEMEGDQLRGQNLGERAVESYQQGIDWAQPCQLDNPQGEGEGDGGEGAPESVAENMVDEGSSTTERIREKRNDAQRELNGEEPSVPQEPEAQQPQPEQQDQDPFAGETADERERREELEQRNQDQQEREREREESQNQRGGTRGW